MLKREKCSVVTYLRKHRPVIFSYAVDEVPLARKTSIRDLGVIFDAKVTFSDHVTDITNHMDLIIEMVEILEMPAP